MKKLFSFGLALALIFTVTPICVNAAEVTSKVTFQYLKGGNLTNFNGKVILSSSIMDGIKIQTDKNKSYYLSYRTKNYGKDTYFPDVKSTVDDYAGSSKTPKMLRLGISVKSKSDNTSINEKIVVMYRAFVGGVWLPWVSNAKAEWMDFVQRKYKLDGTLDYNSGYAGIDSDYITGVEIRIFEKSSIADSKGTAGVKKIIDAPFINQKPDFPTGCESVSTVMALNFMGMDITPKKFINNYLTKGSADSFDPNTSFGGNPESSSGMGCYAPVIEWPPKKRYPVCL